MRILSRSVLAVCATLVFGFGLACGGGGVSDSGIPGAATSSSSSGGEVKSSCDTIASISECGDNTADAYMLGESFVKDVCGMLDGEFKVGAACPTSDIVGHCDDGAGTLSHYYSTGGMGYTADTAKEDCTSIDGKWIPAS